MDSSSFYPISSSYGSVEGQFQKAPMQQGREDNEKQGYWVNASRSGGAVRWMGIIVVTGLLFGAMMAVTSNGAQPRDIRTEENSSLLEITSEVRATGVVASPSSMESTQEPLYFTALNFYQARDGKPGMDYPWLKDFKVVEPHRETSLAVTNPRDGFEYRWEIITGDSNGKTAMGANTVVVLTKLDENVITIEEVDKWGQVSRRLEETVMVKYVRREIRSLTEEDQNELLDAMHALWGERVEGGNGKEKYGDGYSDIWAINRLHFKAATIDGCDHFHDGLGFLVSHTFMSNTFEHSLQIINPKLTLPYWDFTIEASSSAEPKYDPTDPNTRSSVLQAPFFGSYDTRDHIVKDGRWAYTKVASALPGNPGNLNTDVYGNLRSPWNTNDRPYISRGMGQMCSMNFDEDITWPTCQVHYNLVTGYETFYSWVWESLGNPHAPIHFWIGGEDTSLCASIDSQEARQTASQHPEVQMEEIVTKWHPLTLNILVGNIDCTNTYKRIADLVGPAISKSLTHLANACRKDLYCDGIWKCDGIVDSSVKPFKLYEDKICGCLGYDLEQGDDYKFVMETLGYLDILIGHFDEDTQREVIKDICGGVVNYGEHAQSSSPLDPSFWPTHPTMDRLWQFSVLTESVTDFHWPDKDVTVSLPSGEVLLEMTSSYYEDCFGHRGMDVFPFGLLDDDEDDFEVWTGIRGLGAGNNLTNREVLAAFDPRYNSVDYIYDTFKWPHCEEDGVYFDDAWGDTSSMVKSADHRFFERTKPLSGMYTNLKRDMADLMTMGGDV